MIFENRTEEIKFWAMFGYADEAMLYCSMCKDIHENILNCQRND